MFFEINLLCKASGGKFALVWIAGHGAQKRLTSREIDSANISSIIDSLKTYMQSTSNTPTERFSLRLSSTLVLGVVRLHNLQSKLFQNEVFQSYQHYIALSCPMVQQQRREKQKENKKPTKEQRKKTKSTQDTIEELLEQGSIKTILKQHENLEIVHVVDVHQVQPTDDDHSINQNAVARIEDITLVEEIAAPQGEERNDQFGDEYLLFEKCTTAMLPAEHLELDTNQRLSIEETQTGVREMQPEKRKASPYHPQGEDARALKRRRLVEDLDRIEIAAEEGDQQQPAGETVPAPETASEPNVQQAVVGQVTSELVAESLIPASVENADIAAASPAPATKKQRKRIGATRRADLDVPQNQPHKTIPYTNEMREESMDEQFLRIETNETIRPLKDHNWNMSEEAMRNVLNNLGTFKRKSKMLTFAGQTSQRSSSNVSVGIQRRASSKSSSLPNQAHPLHELSPGFQRLSVGDANDEPLVERESIPEVQLETIASLAMPNIAEETGISATSMNVAELSSIRKDDEQSFSASEFNIALPAFQQDSSSESAQKERLNCVKKHLGNVFHWLGNETIDIYQLLPPPKTARAAAAVTIMDLLILKKRKYVSLIKDDKNALTGIVRGERDIKLAN